MAHDQREIWETDNPRCIYWYIYSSILSDAYTILLPLFSLLFSVSLLAFLLASEYTFFSSDTFTLQLVRIGLNQSYAK